jgi:hypothetical protein
MDIDPTIRPIVDMTDVEKVASLLDDLLGDRSIGLAGTVARTSNGSGIVPVDKDGKSINATNIELNQYNYSPKALSRIEIYRQTQNQLRGAKGLLGS